MSPIYQPAAVLLAWTMIMWLWMYATRLPAMQASKLDVPNMVGSLGTDLDGALPQRVQWKAHNYNHLMAEPTVFYATVILLGLVTWDYGLPLWLAWGYVVLRIVHSIFQATVNKVPIRFAIFALSSLCLIGLVLHLLVAAFSA